jgi:ribonuclease HIII
MPGRTWKTIENPVSEEIKLYLLDNGGTEDEVKSLHEVWRVKFSDSTFTYYKTGSLYSTPSNSADPAVFNAWKKINSMVKSTYVLPSKDFLIGFDETGKGEVIGHMVLTGVVFPQEIFEKINWMVGKRSVRLLVSDCKHNAIKGWGVQRGSALFYDGNADRSLRKELER